MRGSEAWNAGAAYERYFARWSRPVAELFVHRLGVPAGRRWLDVGCGTGALGGQGPAPGYVGTLDAERRAALHALLRARLPAAPDGSITLSDRAWAVRGTR